MFRFSLEIHTEAQTHRHADTQTHGHVRTQAHHVYGLALAPAL